MCIQEDTQFSLPIKCLNFQPSCRVLEIANARAIIPMKQDDDDIDREEISHDDSEDAGEFTLSSIIEEADLDNQQEVLHLDQAGCDKILPTTMVPLPKKRTRADTIIAHTSLPNLRHPAGAMARPLLKRQMSTMNITRKSDLVPAQASVSNGSSFGPRGYYRSVWQQSCLVTATGPGNPPAVRVFPGGSVLFGSRTGKKPEPLWSWRVVTRPGHRTAGIWSGWNWTAVPNWPFLQLWLQLSI
jgi:hypothetical protein